MGTGQSTNRQRHAMLRYGNRPAALLLSILLAPAPVAPATELFRPVPERNEGASTYPAAKRRLAEIVDLVESSNAPNLIGPRRWTALLAMHREAITACTTHQRFARIVNKLFKASGVSHFKYYTDEDWSYWYLQGVFADDDDETEVAHVGIFPERIHGRWFVRGIFEGSVADRTKLRVGDELLSVDGEPFSPIAAFRGKAGIPTRIKLRRKPGLLLTVVITPVKESLYHAMQRASRESIRAIDHDELEFAYLHGWTLLGSGVEYNLVLQLQEDVDGLLLDYRDGFGGTWDTALQFLLGERRTRHQPRRNPRWNKPVVILTDDGTRSAKEIVVHAVQEAGRAPLVGQPTPGAVTSVGAVVPVGGDGLLLLPGHSFDLEGKPTQPDHLVKRDIRYSAGSDPQLAKAKEILADLVRQTRAPAGHALRR